MIDTITMGIDIKHFDFSSHPKTITKYSKGRGYNNKKQVLLYSSEMKKRKGLYAPAFEIVEDDRVTKDKKPSHEEYLNITFSAPKLIHGTNFYELTNVDIQALKDKLLYHLRNAGIGCPDNVLDYGEVRRVDFSKNIALPAEFGTAVQMIRLLARYNYKKSSNHDYIISSGNKGESTKYDNRTTSFTFYDKTSEIIENGFTKEEHEIVENIRSGKQPRNYLRLEVSLKTKQWLQKKFKKSKISLDYIFNEELSKKIIIKEFQAVCPHGLALTLDLADKKENVLIEKLLTQGGLKFNEIATFFFISKMMTKNGITHTKRDLELLFNEKIQGRLMKRAENTAKKIIIELPNEINFIEFISERLKEFILIRPPN